MNDLGSLEIMVALLSGHNQAKWLMLNGTKEQQKIAKTYLRREKEMQKFYSKKKSK